MENFIVTPELISEYWNNKKERHKYYAQSVDIADHVQFHSEGFFINPTIYMNVKNFMDSDWQMYRPEMGNPYFFRLIDQRRPSETVVIRGYRRMNYIPITKVPINKVFNSLKKIFKSPDWQIDYSKSEKPSSIPEDDSLYEYCEENFPKFGCLENWAASEGMQWCLKDPNAWWVVMPLGLEIKENEFIKAYPHTIESRNIYDFKEGEYVIFLSPYKSVYLDNKGEQKEGKIITVVTKENYYHAKQTSEKDFKIDTVPHNIGKLPAKIYPGVNLSPDFFSPWHESFIQGMIPALDAAAGDSSDLVAEKLQHLYSTMWYVQSQNCNKCQGTGSTLAYGKQMVCPQCNGQGSPPFSPYRSLEVNLNSLEASGKNIPTPAAGYITKPTEPVKLMREEINTFIEQAYSAVNMEFLSERTQAESGLSKGYTMDETNNFVHNIAYNIIENMLKKVYFFINELRYKKLITNDKDRKGMLPHIPVPESFDFLVNKNSLDELERICKSSVSADLKAMAENDFVQSKYQDNVEAVSRMMCTQKHDPLPGLSPEDSITLKDDGIILLEDCVKHIYLKSFITLALEQDDDFLEKDFDTQKKVFDELTSAKVKELSAAEQIKMKAEIQLAKTQQNPPMNG